MLKSINYITPECIENRMVSGCAKEIESRIYDYLYKLLDEAKDWEKVVITFETKYYE